MTQPTLPNFTNTPPTDLCLIRLSAIGDVCHTVPVVRALQQACPNTRITWIIGKTEYALLKGLDGVDFAVLDKSKGLQGYTELRRHLGSRRFPLSLNMHASMRANLASLMPRSTIRMGFDRARARDGQWYFCNRHIPARTGRHVMDGLFEFVEQLGITPGPPVWNIPAGNEDRQFIERQFEGNAPVLVISPCAGQRFRNYRNWRVERYAAIADYAHARYGARVVLTGGQTPVEQDYGARICELTRTKPLNLIGQTSLKQLFVLLKQASVVLCPDSGPAHMATAAGTPVVGLYATSNRFRTGPYFSQHLVVDKYPEAIRQEFGKAVKDVRWGQRVRDPNAMDLISVDDVKEKLDLALVQVAGKAQE